MRFITKLVPTEMPAEEIAESVSRFLDATAEEETVVSWQITPVAAAWSLPGDGLRDHHYSERGLLIVVAVK